MKPFLLLTSALLTGCASFGSTVLPIENPTVTVLLHNNVKFDNPRVRGDARWWYVGKQKYCLIRLREYPYYLGHEMRHCFEGYWHDERPNGEDY